MKAQIIDWNLKESYGVRKYFKRRNVDGQEQIHFSNPKRGYVEHIQFRNFPQLHIAENQVIQCVFEDCGEIYITSDFGPGFCRFRNIKALHCTSKFLKCCEFENIQCSGTALVEIHKCRMSECAFKNISLQDETLLVYGHGFLCVSGYKLDGVTTERKDGKLFYGNERSWRPFVIE